MLPLYAAPKKMNRHGYSGSHDKKTPTSPVPLGYVGRTNTSGESGRGYKIKTDKWEKCVLISHLVNHVFQTAAWMKRRV